MGSWFLPSVLSAWWKGMNWSHHQHTKGNRLETPIQGTLQNLKRGFSVQMFPNETNSSGTWYLIFLFRFLFHYQFQLSEIHTYFSNLCLVYFLLFLSPWTRAQARTKPPSPHVARQGRSAALVCRVGMYSRNATLHWVCLQTSWKQ